MSVLGVSDPDAQVDPEKAAPPKETPPAQPPEGADDAHPMRDALYPKADKPKAEPKTDAVKPKADASADMSGKPEAGKDKPEKPEEATPTPKPEWDKGRQERDQLRASNKALKEQLAAVSKSVGDIQTAQRDQVTAAEKARRDQAVGKVDELLGTLNADSNAEQFTEAFKALRSLADITPQAGDSPAVAALTEQVENLQAKLDRREAEDQARDEAAAETAADSEWDSFLKRMDDEHGAEFRADAVKAASAYFTARGYTRDNPPDDEVGMARVETEFVKLAAKAGSKKTEAGAAPAADVPLDTGVGGGVAADLEGGTLDESVALMRKEGKFDKVVMPSH